MQPDLSNLVIVLVRPRFPKNIGAAARAGANLGLGGLRVVEPLRLWPEPMQRLAGSQGRPLLEALQVVGSLEEALADTVGAAATTARDGYKRGRLLSPRQAAPELLTWAGQGRVALVFGPEDRGLTTAELDRCQLGVSIPTTEASSLNLAQAVVVLAYELRMAALTDQALRRPGPPPASLEDLAGLREHLLKALVAIGTLPADNPEHFFRPIKAGLERARLSSREVRALRGIARQMLWLAGRTQGRD
ncbi:MAG: TrmH family RNA methyltransferase [Thermodesulfobacteriota bacterium]